MRGNCPKPPFTLNKIFETKAREIAESSGGYDRNDSVATTPLECTGMHGYARIHPNYRVLFVKALTSGSEVICMNLL